MKAPRQTSDIGKSAEWVCLYLTGGVFILCVCECVSQAQMGPQSDEQLPGPWDNLELMDPEQVSLLGLQPFWEGGRIGNV